MIEHDDTIGTLLKALDDMGIADNTIVVYTTDNGPHMNTWPDGAMTPFRSEKNTNWEGAFRVPCLVRWPGDDQAGHGHQRADEPQRLDPDALRRSPASRTSSASCKKGYTANGIDYKVHLDGYDQSKFLHDRRAAPSARTTASRAPATSSSTPTTTACSSACGRATTSTSSPSSAWPGTMGVWAEPFTTLRLQKIFNLYPGPVRAGRHHVEHLLGLAAQPRRQRVRRDGRGLQVRGDVQGVPAALVPAELQPGEHPGGDARRHQDAGRSSRRASTLRGFAR